MPIETATGGQAKYQEVPVYHFYVGNADSSRWSVYWNGSGELDAHNEASMRLSGGKKYVKADTNVRPILPGGHQSGASYYFTDQLTGACGKALDTNANIIAVASNKFGSPDHNCGDKYYIDIPGLNNTIFTVEDTGSFTVENGARDHFDIYVGVQTHDSYYGNSNYTSSDGNPYRVAKAQP